MSNKPIEISIPEWKEIMEMDEIRESWGLDDETTPEQFSSIAYGVKFAFISGGPGYVGDLYILEGDSIEEPIVLIRKNGVLEFVN